MTASMRIVFAGSDEFACVQLAALVNAELDVRGVLTRPETRSGRGRRLQRSPVHELAERHALPVATPRGLKQPEQRAELEAMAPDLMVVASYGVILPQTVLDLPPAGCLNVHPSLLPRWRGAAPIERCLLAGDEETGVCIMQMDAGLDTGPVRAQRTLPMTPGETGGEMRDRLAHTGAALLLDVLSDLDRFPPVPQADAGATYADRITRESPRFDFTANAISLARHVLALSPRQPVQVSCGTFRLNLLRAEALPETADAAGTPGALLGTPRSGMHLATGDGVLLVNEARLVGGKGSLLRGADLANAVRQRVPADELFDVG